MSRAENKAERLLKMEALLLAHPEGLTQAEMARHLGVDRSVIHRNLYDFQKIYPTIEHDDGRISLDRSAYLVKVAFTLHEATAVHIAARLLATRMDAWAATVALEAGKPVDLRIDYHEIKGQASVRFGWSATDDPEPLLNEALQAASWADAVVVVSTINEGEGRDRAYLGLPGDQPRVIQRLVATGKPVVVVLLAGSPVTMGDWIAGVSAVLDAWYPGQEGGTAIAEALFGKMNPNGKLPMTFPLTVGQCPVYYNLPPSGRGYDYVDSTGRPLFAFGHGLSYTTFEYSNLKVSPNPASRKGAIRVTFTLRNSGGRTGKEVAQVYFRDEVASIVRPLKELKGYAKVQLEPGEEKTVVVDVPMERLSFLNERMRRVVEPGWFEVMVGSSSEDIRLRTRIEVR